MVGILFLLDIEYAPYMNRYRDILKRCNVEYEIITWNRLASVKDEKVISYFNPAKLGDSKFHKAVDFYKYGQFLKRKLKEKKYDKLIVLTTLTGMLCFKTLIKDYPGKYIFDIRDYSYENLAIYRYCEKKLINHSAYTVISSEGFKEFLPKNEKYVLCHNFIPGEVQSARDYISCKKFFSLPEGKIVISFIGAVRFFSIDSKVADIFGNDNRFELRFHGYGISYEQLKNYIQEKGYNNIFVTGRYDRSEKNALMDNVSLINGYYDDKNIANRLSMSNKYYDTLIYKIPFWGNPDCFVGKKTIGNGIGIEAKLDENVKEHIISIFSNFDYEEFANNCELELRNIIQEDNGFIGAVEKFIYEG